MTWVRVALFVDPGPAEFVRYCLVAAGIRAEVHHEPLAGRLWFVSQRDTGLRLEVPADESERAERLLQEWDPGTAFMQLAIRCPECGSFRIDFPQFTQKSILTNISMGLASGLGLIEKDFYCEDCHHTWRKPNSKPRHARAHMAPNYFLDGID